MSETKHTIEQLQAMPDGELAELAARLRGWTLEDDKPPEELLPPIRKNNKWPAWFEAGKFTGFAPHGLPHYLTRWNPAADIGQAYGLLVWAVEQGQFREFIICKGATWARDGLRLRAGDGGNAMKDFYVSWWNKGWRAAWRHHRKGIPIGRGFVPSGAKYADWRNGVTAYRDKHGLPDND